MPARPTSGLQPKVNELFERVEITAKEADQMPGKMRPQTMELKPGDEIALRYLGAAVVLQWQNLPEQAQQALLQQAVSVGGLPPVTSLHEQIRALIRRTRDANIAKLRLVGLRASNPSSTSRTRPEEGARTD
jgi:hypothetical protein